MAHLGDAAADRVEHLEGRHHLARRADTVICRRPPESAAMRSATRSADMPGPGRRFGHDVTMRQRLPCARATDGRGERAARARAPANESCGV